MHTTPLAIFIEDQKLEQQNDWVSSVIGSYWKKLLCRAKWQSGFQFLLLPSDNTEMTISMRKRGTSSRLFLCWQKNLSSLFFYGILMTLNKVDDLAKWRVLRRGELVNHSLQSSIIILPTI